MSMLVISLWLAALTAIQIDGAGRCPAAAAVDERLAPLLAPGGAPSASDRAVLVEDADGALSVSLAARRRSAHRQSTPAARGELRRAGRDGGRRAGGLGGRDPPRDLPAARAPGRGGGGAAAGARRRDSAGRRRRAASPLDGGDRGRAARLMAAGLRRARRAARCDARRRRSPLAREAVGGGRGRAHARAPARRGELVAPHRRTRRRLCDSSRPALAAGAGGRGRRGGGHVAEAPGSRPTAACAASTPASRPVCGPSCRWARFAPGRGSRP